MKSELAVAATAAAAATATTAAAAAVAAAATAAACAASALLNYKTSAGTSEMKAKSITSDDNHRLVVKQFQNDNI